MPAAPKLATAPRRSARAAALAAAGLLAALGSAAIGQELSLAGLQAEIQELFERAEDAVVQVQAIVVREPQSPGEPPAPQITNIGTGFAINGRSEILTTHDLVAGSRQISVIAGNRLYPAQFIAGDDNTNIAILQSEPLTEFLELGNSDETRVGSWVLFVGCPYGAGPSPSWGMVTGRDLHRIRPNFTTSHIRASLGVAPGQPGGPLLDISGRAIGMVVARSTDPMLCYALPINAVKKIRSDLVRFRALRQPWLGIEIFEDYKSGERQVRIGRVQPNTPAYVSDLQRDDQIVAIAGTPVRQAADVLDSTFYAEIGRPITITIQRADRTLEINVEVAERPPEPAPGPTR